ncbi:MAG: glycoside hydrolase family 15 protein [Thermoplasmata archaeon]|nr:glycoside hydrolase family 15 protein [Thermoplasmata archaeon]
MRSPARRSASGPRRASGRNRETPPKDPPATPAWDTIYSYGAIGNLRTAALVSARGSIDWACLPRFAAPSVFGRLLDRARGGFHLVEPESCKVTTQRYVPATNVLRTHFLLEGARQLTVTDFMPVAKARTAVPEPRIVRRLEAEGGPVPVRLVVEPRFDYGRAPAPRWQVSGKGTIRARSGSALLNLFSPGSWQVEGRVAASTFAVRPGQGATTEILWGEGTPLASPDASLRDTIRFWRGWVHRPDSPMHRAAHVWHDWVERSELLLKLLSDHESGAFVAAPTTSLPEWPGGPRNWDYRYVWVRDAAFAAQAFIALGHLEEARQYFRWLLSAMPRKGARVPLRTLYDLSGEAPPHEERLDHWDGYAGSKPIRIGNAAASQLQLDIFGEVVGSAAQLAHADPEFVRKAWPRLRPLAELAAREWTRRDSGIWESRAAPTHYTHSKLMCWVAVARGAELAERFGEPSRAEEFRVAAEAIRRVLLDRGFDQRLGGFVQGFDRRWPDASLLRVPMVGFLPYTDSRVQGTIRLVEEKLTRGPFVYRYSSSRSLHGPEGAFLLCSFWLVECLARSGERARAVRNFRELLKVAGPLRLFSEEYDPTGAVPLGNYPQAFTHIGVLRAAMAIGAEPAS